MGVEGAKAILKSWGIAHLKGQRLLGRSLKVEARPGSTAQTRQF